MFLDEFSFLVFYFQLLHKQNAVVCFWRIQATSLSVQAKCKRQNAKGKGAKRRVKGTLFESWDCYFIYLCY